MAESAVSFLFNQLTRFLQQEQELLGGIGDNAVYIRDELGQMRAFLRAADEKEESDAQLKEWVKQVREITYDTENVLERYMLKLAHLHSDADGYKKYIKKMYASAKKLMVRRQIASEFQKIKLRMENVAKTQQRFKGIYDFKDQGSSSKTYDSRGDALLLEEDEVVGIEEPKKQLVQWLKQIDDGFMVISVVGMGGLGKTTLVKKIYDDASVKANFDCHVWVTVSENFDLKHLLRDLINQLANEVKLLPPQNLEAMNCDEMKEYVYKFLKDKTYLIILDDVWKIDVWESIKYAFPRKIARGRTIVTTRLYNIGNAVCSETCGHLYNLDPLTVENSKKLFYRKAFPGNSCPSYLNEISESILKRCEGLPLAIVVIGGLLATKNNNFEEWKIFERTIGLELQGDYLKRMNRLLSLSYYDLPYYLKACFLYLSIFREDEFLEKWEVIRLWLAEGFVEAKDGKTLEEVAEAYLNELLNRNLIQVALTGLDRRPKGFRIHDVLREYIISKSREQNLTVSSGGEMVYPDKIRRMTIHSRFKETEEFYNVKYLRSLFWLEFADSEFGLIFHKVLSHCRLLKVLNLREAPIDSIPNEVFKLYHLKYLGLSGTNIKVIPKSIGNLQNLETLDLERSKVTELPIEILKLRKLRHILVSPHNTTDPVSFDLYAQGLKAPYEIGSYLRSLQTLSRIDADEADGIKIVREIGKLTQLRLLGITKLRREDGRDLCFSLVKLTNLRRLCISCINEDEVMDLDHSLSSLSLPFLRVIFLRGHLEKFPQWVCSLHGLSVVQLLWSRLRGDPLQHLEDLPNLVLLHMGMLAYEGEKLIFKGRKFQKLERLSLEGLRGLRCVRVEKDSMHNLKEFDLWDCEQMDELPDGIEHLRNLQFLDLVNMSEKFNGRLAEQKLKGGHEWQLAHVAKIVVVNFVDNGFRQLVDFVDMSSNYGKE